MLRINLNGKEILVFGDAYCPDNKRYMIVSYKEYADFIGDGAEHIDTTKIFEEVLDFDSRSDKPEDPS